jgi:hypothetical protein
MIKTAEKEVNRFGARKYDYVHSSTDPDKVYSVVKIRISGTRNYKYTCTCPDFTFRQRACKHIKQFKKRE